jgi:hypothetical protein
MNLDYVVIFSHFISIHFFLIIIIIVTEYSFHVMLYAHFNMARHYIRLNFTPRLRSVLNIDKYNASPC